MSKEEKRTYFWQTPNMIDDIDLSRNALRLFLHFLRICGNDGKCTQGSRLLAKWCGMGSTTVVNSKKELVAAGLIRISTIKTPSGPGDQVEIVKDVWKFNKLVYRGEPGELDSLPESKLKTTALQARSRYRKLLPGRMSIIPNDFSITQEMREWAKVDVPDIDIDRETERFVRFFEGAEINMHDWEKFWKKWMCNNAVCNY